ncbi:MAG: methionine biosynthesis protein MetW, partial [Elusimicrobia bacterium]|nr:methionine biosynthesis protein MetW [Elusimicrobiota bacterium]
MREKNALLEDEIIFNLIEPSSKVLVLGCGEGKLLERLVRDKKIFG